jgi:hypothetical protein
MAILFFSFTCFLLPVLDAACIGMNPSFDKVDTVSFPIYVVVSNVPKDILSTQ